MIKIHPNDKSIGSSFNLGDKKLTLAQLKAKLEKMDSVIVKAKRIGFEMLKMVKPKVIDIKEDIERKGKKHKKDYKFEED